MDTNDRQVKIKYRLEYSVVSAKYYNQFGTCVSQNSRDKEQIIIASSDEEAKLKAKAFLYDEGERYYSAQFKKLSKIEKESQEEESSLVPLEA